ncbi:MAG: class I SAM-dependent rRNA methyltransferase [Oscillospiraceae bacterium]|nr:class I SAM-dependent rRNA methyltransferase [Oscillospiraceae bacterium]
MERIFPKAIITHKGEKALRGGHPWVYSDEVSQVVGDYENGDLMDVYSAKNRFLGTGFINDHSKIRVRVISRNANDKFDRAFYGRRIRYALEYRKTVMGEDFACCRLIFGEADSFPGFTVDRFGEILVTQVLSLGIERIKEMLYELLVEELNALGVWISAIYERNDVKIRELEGMEQYTGFWSGLRTDLPGVTEIVENGIRYSVDYVNGQKTGFFLDQKYNRRAIRQIAEGRTVLDCFTHTGAFALNAAAAGAKLVNAVDISEDAVEMARANARLNGLEGNMQFTCANVFDLLTDLYKRNGSPYDFIILDPPAFTKSSSTVKNAIRGYKEINLKAMRLLNRGGYLATCSCSHFMTEPLFKQMLHDAAADAEVSLRQIEARQQSPDHPILWNVTETDYLKFFIFQVV